MTETLGFLVSFYSQKPIFSEQFSSIKVSICDFDVLSNMQRGKLFQWWCLFISVPRL